MLANLLLTFLLGGLWHGAAWTFVCWGALHGLGLCCVRIWNRSGHRLPRFAAWAITFAFVVVTWVFFRAHSIGDAWSIVRAMAGLSPAGVTVAHAGIQATLDALLAVHPLRRCRSPRVLRSCSGAGTPTHSCGRYPHHGSSPPQPRRALTLSVLQLGNVAPFLYFNF